MTITPKRSPRSRLKKLNISTKEKWRKILNDIDKRHIPLTLLISVDVNLIDGTKVTIDIKELLEENDAETLSKVLDIKLKTMEDIIKDVDFLVSIDDVANTVQPITDSMLKDL